MSQLIRKSANARQELFIWLALLVGLTLTGVGWLIAENIDLSRDFSPAIILIAYAPSLAAIITSGITGGWRSIKSLFAQLGKWRTPPKWYMIALLLPVAIVAIAYGIYRLLGGEAPSPWIDFAALAPGFAAIIAGGLGEELGWRGFAQPRLGRRFSIFWASIIVGVIWATWHSWPLLTIGGLEGPWLVDTALTYLRLVSTAVIYGWLYQVSGGSLLLIIIAHMAHNVVLTAIPVPENSQLLATLIALLYFAAALIITSIARHQLFSKPSPILLNK